MAAVTRVYLTRSASFRRRGTARLHFENGQGGTACGGDRLDPDSGRPALGVAVDRRCRGLGCADRWARIDAGPDLLASSS